MDTPATPKAPSQEPEKYIRTFHGDMKTLEEGGVPDLAPVSQASTSRDRLVAASPIPERPPQAPPPPPAPEKPAYVPPPALTAPIKTYTSDFSQLIKDTQASPASVLAAEQDKAPRTFTGTTDSSRNVLYIIAGASLLVVGVASALFAYLRYGAGETPVVTQPLIAAPIFVDDRYEVASGGDVAAAVREAIARPLAAGKVRLLHTASSTDNLVASMLSSRAPSILLRNMKETGTMLGVVSVAGAPAVAQSPFFILSVASYSATFAGMLSWETVILRDLGTLYPAHQPGSQSEGASSGAGTSTPPGGASGTPTPAAPLVFRDEVVSNHDVRIYRDAQGRSVLLYGYWNPTTLIIARDAAAFGEITERLANSNR